MVHIDVELRELLSVNFEKHISTQYAPNGDLIDIQNNSHLMSIIQTSEKDL